MKNADSPFKPYAPFIGKTKTPDGSYPIYSDLGLPYANMVFLGGKNISALADVIRVTKPSGGRILEGPSPAD